MSALNMGIILIGVPIFVYVLFRAAALGWFGAKHAYQRRLVDGIRKGDH